VTWKKGFEGRGDNVTTVAFFAESHDAVVSRDVVLHEKRAIAAGNEAAVSLQEYVSHVRLVLRAVAQHHAHGSLGARIA
jgi:hypothetical protein